MMKEKLLLFLFVLIVQFLTAQNGYPKLILWGSDSVVAYTPAQVKLINYNKDSYDECRVDLKSYRIEVDQLRKAIASEKESNRQCDTSLSYSNRIVEEYEIQNMALNDNNKRLEKKIKLSKPIKYIFGLGGIVIGFYTGNKAYNIIKL